MAMNTMPCFVDREIILNCVWWSGIWGPWGPDEALRFQGNVITTGELFICHGPPRGDYKP
jgi:hypothetical protein